MAWTDYADEQADHQGIRFVCSDVRMSMELHGCKHAKCQDSLKQALKSCFPCMRLDSFKHRSYSRGQLTPDQS